MIPDCEDCGKPAVVVLRDVIITDEPLWTLLDEHPLCKDHKRFSFILSQDGRQRGYVNEYGNPILYSWEQN